MSFPELIGFFGGALTTLAFVPQVWRLFKLKSAREVSMPFTIMFMVGVMAWLAYGLLLHIRPVILWNAVTLALVVVMLIAKLRFGRN